MFQAVDEFTSCSGGVVFLVSLKVGGCALNLVAANVVFVMDPWWNPAVEQQAVSFCLLPLFIDEDGTRLSTWANKESSLLPTHCARQHRRKD